MKPVITVRGAINALIDEVRSRGFKKALIVTDKDLVKFKVVKKITDLLDRAKLKYTIFDAVKANPSVEVVQKGVKAFQKAKADYMIAIGGGSPQDTAKAIGIIINNPEFADVVSLEGAAPTKNKCVPVIAIPQPPEQRPKRRLTMSLRMRKNVGNLCALTRMIFRLFPLWIRI